MWGPGQAGASASQSVLFIICIVYLKYRLQCWRLQKLSAQAWFPLLAFQIIHCCPQQASEPVPCLLTWALKANAVQHLPRGSIVTTYATLCADRVSKRRRTSLSVERCCEGR
jgi:hypothetical protein